MAYARAALLLILLLTLKCFSALRCLGVRSHSSISRRSSVRVASRFALHLRKEEREGRYEDEDVFDDDGEANDDAQDFGRAFNRKLGSASKQQQQQQKKPSSILKSSTMNRWGLLNRALFAGVFVAGIGTGITIDSAINTNPKDLASRDAIDKNAPNPKLCAAYGSSAMVLDQRVFVTFNPFNVYVTQADTKPGCVLRPSNVVSQLQKERQLITDEDVDACKNGFNTWAFVGDINSKPQLNCVFQSDDAQNEFLSNPKVGLGEDIYDGREDVEAAKSAASSVFKKMQEAATSQ